MFPSSGLFSHTNCPLSHRGSCEKPHCLYKHATEPRERCVGSSKSAAVDLTGNRRESSFAPVNDNSLHELERLDKEIETVRHEVEQEQRRLSCYQTNQADRSGNKPKVEASLSYAFPSSKDHKSHFQANKYVVDNSKPRTDLEYDPLSNFSAALRSYSSSGKEHKVKNQQEGKSSRSIHLGEKPNAHQAQMYQPPSPDLLDDAIEDGVLVIDVSLSPVRTSDQTENTADSTSAKSSQDAERDTKEIKAVNVFCGSPSHEVKTKVVNAAALSASSDGASKASESVVSTPETQKFYWKDGSVVDLTGFLENFERECVPQTETSCNVDKSKSQPHKRPDFAPQLKRRSPDPALKTDQGEVPSPSCSQNGPPHVRDVEKSATLANLKAFMNQKQVEAAQGSSPIQSESTEQPQMGEDEVIIINSSPESVDEEDESIYSDMELSESDPMEECYRIFMEANGNEKGNEQSDTSIRADMGAKKPEVNASAQTLTGKKRVAHESNNLEQPLAKTRPQPQVLVPLREPATSGSRPSVCSKIQQVQQRASMITAPIKAGQNLTSTFSRKKPETQGVPSALTTNIPQPAGVQNAYLNCVPPGTAVIEVGNNVHLILPHGSFPLSVSATPSPVASVLTPVSRLHAIPNATRQTNAPAAVTQLLRYRSMAPVLIAAPARRPAFNTAFGSASLQSTVGASTSTQAGALAATKSLPVKRKLKQQSEAAKDKVPHDVRQRYVSMFTEEFLKTSADTNEAFEKALMEEKSVYNRSVNKLRYLSIAVNALKRIKNQSAASKNETQTQNQRPKGNIPFNPKKMTQNAGDVVLYEILKGYTLTDEQMTENNYPVQHPEKPGSAVLFSDKKVSADPLKRICCRCGATYSVSKTGKHLRTEECNYHYGKGVTNRVPGGVETRYSCCQGVMGAPGCQMFKLHVHEFLSLDGFVCTAPRSPSDVSCPGVYSLDCEMCYTVNGLELSRVSVINSNLQVIYDTFVRPDSEVIDYNTRFSGISEEDVKGNHTSLREIQETLLSFISADTILVGHGLETDFCLLKLIHGTVVDTSVVFPHRLGPPNKLSLNRLTAEHLRRIIQESVCGHDTGEDATACMELMLWKLKEDGKLKK